MKLTIELVPKTAWNQSLANLLPRSVWIGIRESHIQQNAKKCEICGQTEGIFNLHEIWKYDDFTHIQRLDSFVLLCTWCHHIKHIGLAGILADEGKLDYDKLVEHFCAVNSCSPKEFEKCVKDAFVMWEKRSLYKWQQDFGEYSKYLKK